MAERTSAMWIKKIVYLSAASRHILIIKMQEQNQMSQSLTWWCKDGSKLVISSEQCRW